MVCSFRLDATYSHVRGKVGEEEGEQGSRGAGEQGELRFSQTSRAISIEIYRINNINHLNLLLPTILVIRMLETAIPIQAKSTLSPMPDKNGQPSHPKTQARTSDPVVGSFGSSKRTLVLSTFCETPTLVKQHFFERGELIPLEPSVFYRIEWGIVCASTWDEDGKSTT